jgi:hypothetical protein
MPDFKQRESSMTHDDAFALVNSAIDSLVEHDLELFELDVTERSLAHQLARYMSTRVDPVLSVDCEYNRHFADPKRLHLPPRNTTDRDIRATTVFPDIIVHERNTDTRNFLVLELKKPNESIEYDELKLRAFRRELGYRHAAHVILGRGRDGKIIREVRWVND